MSVSVLVLTLNEEINLPDCLASASWSDDIVVLDSHSTDRTLEIARKAGARCYQRSFDNYSAHRDWARREITYTHPWVFSIDADERFTPELVAEIQEAVRLAPEDMAMYLVTRKDYFMGRWIRFSSSSPIWFERLYRPERVRMTERIVNEHMATEGRIGYLRSPMLHYPFNKGITYWFNRHNVYSSMEAIEYMKAHDQYGDWKALFSSQPITRRLALKRLASHLPFRPLLKFCYLYFGRMGLFDGRAGFTYCMLQAIYEHFISLKIREAQRRQQGLPI